MTRLVGLFTCVAVAWPVAAAATDMDDCRQARRPDLRLPACTRVIDAAGTSDDDKALAYRFRADVRSDAGAVGEAIADFTQAIKLNPANLPAISGRGLARLTAGDLAGALSDYDEAVRLAPNQAPLLVTRGHIKLASGNVDGAIDDLSQAITLSPQSAVAWNNRGLAYRRKGDLAQADADYTSAIGFNPVYALAYANRGYVREALTRKPEAIEDLRRALLLDPSLSEARETLKRLGGADTATDESGRRIALGKTLVETNCARCHAVGLNGASPNPKSPEFRNLRRRHPQLALREPLTRGILAQHDEMPRFPLSNADIDAILAYISSLPAAP
jgi:tetratricopeptide (TPR) repeat protein